MRALVLLAALACASPAWAATYYVDGSGGSGSASLCGSVTTYNPVAGTCTGGSSTVRNTIQAGILLMSAGDRLEIRGGTYAESISMNVFTIPNGTSYGNAITIAAYTGEAVTIRPTSEDAVVLSGTRQYIIFDSLVFDGANITNVEVVWVGDGSHHIRFIDSEIKNNGNDDVRDLYVVSVTAHHVEWLGGSIHDTGEATISGYCAYIIGNDNLIDGTTMYNCDGYGIHNYTGGATGNNNIFRNNIIHDVSGSMQTALGTGILLGGGGGDDNIAYNNLVYNVDYGIGIQGTGNVAYNNTLDTGIVGIDFVGGSATGSVLRNNIISNYSDTAIRTNGAAVTRTNNRCYSVTTGCTGSDTTGNPLYVGSGNYALQSGSAAIDAGFDLSGVFTVDIVGVTRPQGASFDVGAYEFTAGGASNRPRLR